MNSFYFRRFVVILIWKILLWDQRCEAAGPCVLLDPLATTGTACIPVDLINRAFAEARQRVGLDQPFSGPHIKSHHDEIDKLGNALIETSRIIAAEFQLDWQQVYTLLPNLDVSLTDIWEFCPTQFKHKVCKASRYRSLTGHCNNLDHPDWGATVVPFANILPPRRSDGISGPREDSEGGALPSARLVSSVMHRDTVVHDHSITTMLIAWGQIIDHDITLTGDTKDPQSLKEPDCCNTSPNVGPFPSPPSASRHHNCFPIEIPATDTFYRRYGRHCMNFLRSFAGVRSECRLGPRTAFNTISSFLDANFAYGSTPELGSQLRAGKHGLLKSLPVFHDYGLKPLLPPKIEEPEDGCIRPNGDVFCFLAGDNRVNEQLILTVLHTVFLREHNRIAEQLYAINPHWEDELIFQESRRIVIATTQHITFNEFLPMVLGKELMAKYGLELQQEGYWNGYDPQVNPTAAEEFITSAFRFGHSLLPNRIERWSLSHKFVDSEPLHKLLRQPYDVYRPGYIDTFIMGLVNQLAQAMDEGVTEEVTTLLFKDPGQHFGMDLAAMNIQRGREHGVPGYAAYREICGLSPIHSWDDLIGIMRNETVYKYKTVYRSPHDIDLWSGGVSEISNVGSLVGPTFGCIIAQQFQAIRYGDRFWYEAGDWPSSFTPEQLQEIRKVKLSRLLCDNSDHVKSIQIYAMVYPDLHLNPRTSCQSLSASGIDFEKWRDLAVPVPDPPHPLPEPLQKHPELTIETPHVHYSPQYEQFNDHHQHLTTLHTVPAALSNYSTSGHNNHVFISSPHDSSSPNSEFVSTHLTSSDPYIIDQYSYSLLGANSSGSSSGDNNNNNSLDSSRHESHSQMVKAIPHHYHVAADDEYVLVKEIQVPRNLGGRPSPRKSHGRRRNKLPPVKPYPENQPFPGLDGLFSPNPGYLVRKRFRVQQRGGGARPRLQQPRQSPWRAILG